VSVRIVPAGVPAQPSGDDMSGPGVRKPASRRLLSAVPLLVAAVLLVPGPTIAAAVPAGPGAPTGTGGWVAAPLPVVPNPEGWAVVTGTDGARTFTGRLGSKAVLWTPERITVLDTGAALDVNRHGDVVGYRQQPGDPDSGVPTLWRGGRPIYLALPAGARHAYPQSINDSGLIVGTATYGGSQEIPVAWSADNPSRVRDLSATFPGITPLAVTGAGVVVGNTVSGAVAVSGTLAAGPAVLPWLNGATATRVADAACEYITGAQSLPGEGWQPVLWKDGRVQRIPNGPGQSDGEGNAVNCHGTVAGTGGWGSWVREPGASPVLLPPLDGGYYAGASEITDQGLVAGYTVRHDGTTVPVLWTRQ
jgi:uncharacterized membrane protein